MKKSLLLNSILILSFVVLPASTAGAASPNPRSLRSPKVSASPGRLDKGLKLACQNRQAAIKNRSKNLVRHATKMVTTFDRIATRAKTYYQDKLVPKGVTVSDYATLVANVETAKSAVTSAASNAEQTITGFDCEKGTAKETLTSYREGMQQTNEKLKAYREAVRKLVQAIHKAAVDAKPSAKPTVSPTTSPSPTP